ncbi:Nitric oxide reductase activation protein NorE [hydrothermal vent metagenome]|uniref:Nitric oxide reductase activation protein NorE n=1 Tax=hydrothermal vent metagenome TaxID=652676 RepID=A0A1W1BWH1_9ZZZZ
MNKEKPKHPAGDFAVWIIIYIELLTFGLFFIGYIYSRRGDIELFNASQLLLDQRAGFINTILLLTSSYFVVKAINIIKTINTQEAFNRASNWLLGAIGLGGLFLILKMTEFIGKYHEGINLSTNSFFMFYFLLTMFHFMHVVLGMIILFNLYQKTKIGGYTKEEHIGLESGASYWHMVDLLWIVLFPLIYIIR